MKKLCGCCGLPGHLSGEGTPTVTPSLPAQGQALPMGAHQTYGAWGSPCSPTALPSTSTTIQPTLTAIPALLLPHHLLGHPGNKNDQDTWTELLLNANQKSQYCCMWFVTTTNIFVLLPVKKWDKLCNLPDDKKEEVFEQDYKVIFK